tara:strand:- start:613 stop:1836 length:1224 start_codon:yes stop_codon:yes gene_type:complete
MNCRHCGTPLRHKFLDLGFAPPSNSYRRLGDLSRPELSFPLRLNVCHCCWLVQIEDYAEAGELFTDDYAYFSSTSSTWLAHASRYCEAMIDELELTSASYVIELACNDGYLLRNFVDAGIPCLGIEPTARTADAAEKLGIPVLRKFFGESLGEKLAKNGHRADLIIGNNVYAHVPDINDFTLGLKAALNCGGTITLEFPHVMQLLAQSQFDTVYHEHFSYLSLTAVDQIFSAAGLRVWRVEELQTHGGSLRVYGCHSGDTRNTEQSVQGVLRTEADYGLTRLDTYHQLQESAERIKRDLLTFLLEKKLAGETVVAYGAAAKGNTLLNYAGIKPDLLPLVCDAAEAKQGMFMPGSHIPIVPSATIGELKPDYVIVLPWNIIDEVKLQNDELVKSGVQFVIAIPELTIL